MFEHYNGYELDSEFETSNLFGLFTFTVHMLSDAWP